MGPRCKSALANLADQGPVIMGRYHYVANWIATVRLGAKWSHGQVASYMWLLIKEAHMAAMQRGKTTSCKFVVRGGVEPDGTCNPPTTLRRGATKLKWRPVVGSKERGRKVVTYVRDVLPGFDE